MCKIFKHFEALIKMFFDWRLHFFTERNYKDVKQWMPLVELLISKYSHRKYFLSVKVFQSMLDPAAVVYKRRLD